jgi:hypothetical protein
MGKSQHKKIAALLMFFMQGLYLHPVLKSEEQVASQLYKDHSSPNFEQARICFS